MPNLMNQNMGYAGMMANPSMMGNPGIMTDPSFMQNYVNGGQPMPMVQNQFNQMIAN